MSKVSRLSRSGKELVYFRVVGQVAAIQSLETQRHILSSPGSSLGWDGGAFFSTLANASLPFLFRLIFLPFFCLKKIYIYK